MTVDDGDLPWLPSNQLVNQSINQSINNCMSQVWRGEDHVIYPNEFKNMVDEIDPRFRGVKDQHDSFEFFVEVLINKLHQELSTFHSSPSLSLSTMATTQLTISSNSLNPTTPTSSSASVANSTTFITPSLSPSSAVSRSQSIQPRTSVLLLASSSSSSSASSSSRPRSTSTENRPHSNSNASGPSQEQTTRSSEVG